MDADAGDLKVKVNRFLTQIYADKIRCDTQDLHGLICVHLRKSALNELDLPRWTTDK